MEWKGKKGGKRWKGEKERVSKEEKGRDNRQGEGEIKVKLEDRKNCLSGMKGKTQVGKKEREKRG